MTKLLSFFFLCQVAFSIAGVVYGPDYPLVFLLIGTVLFSLIGYVYHRYNKAQANIQRSIEQGLLSLIDGDFSVSIAPKKHPIYDSVFTVFNQCAEKLRKERQHLYQREMLLDKVLNTSPVVTFLVSPDHKIIFANRAAELMFNHGESLLGHDWLAIRNELDGGFAEALQNSGESIFTLKDASGEEQAWHLAKSGMRIHQASHTLYLLKSITHELGRQEVQTWKKVIRVLSHELNNSIAPISSMCHSGQLLAQNLEEPRLDRVFSSISRRIGHLNEFIKGYGELSKLKLPSKTLIRWPALLEQLNALYPFELTNEIPESALYADEHQLEQVLINILKNAHEAQSEQAQTPLVQLRFIELERQGITIEVRDFGTGMAQEVLENALLPFYSTKHSGTGLGLALCREIIDAHQGKLAFRNCEDGGAIVSVYLPC
ncbi:MULTISPECIES: sensor histidine kinase [Pseudoalteromonas]|uniref:histidine kinase n=1 Tax=Pseudoalteromonas obscura TaxID=3048491 RepID=A0ABT7EM30_9GAMM|nr:MULTISPECIES: ATP-binding protein [Pseudoalteromonas]MBQ4837963.1 GHKL domain-containing protein [Pseudoalteromonas luteoviolacea]MDK2596091.1 ATP-binding protein [Pseudoalteromonas sp. P94(2023)]